jgi:hypothetical protein
MGVEMKFKARVRMFGEERKVIEIPKSIRDNIKAGVYYEVELK